MPHQASEQMLGYIYQIYFALKLLLEAEYDEEQICIEKFDDVSIIHSDGLIDYAQLKLHKKSCGDLSNASVDIWKTLRVWIDAINEDRSLLTKTTFLLITTAKPALGSVAEMLQSDRPDCDAIFKTLKSIALQSKNKDTKKARDVFLKLNDVDAITLLSHMKIISNAPDLEGIKREIQRSIRNACPIGHEKNVYLRLIGWWNDIVTKGLASENPHFISKLEVRRKLFGIASEYTEDNLPIDVPQNYQTFGDEEEKRIFIKQIKLIWHTQKTINAAKRDFYRAYEQRSRWVRDSLIDFDDLESYDERLEDEWERLFDAMEIELENISDVEEHDLKKYGHQLYQTIMDNRLHIRAKCTEPFIMRGSYQMLSDHKRVGWHKEYLSRLVDDEEKKMEGKE